MVCFIYFCLYCAFPFILILMLLICIVSKKVYVYEDSYCVLIESKLPSINGASYWPESWPTLVARHKRSLEELNRGTIAHFVSCLEGSCQVWDPAVIPITVF